MKKVYIENVRIISMLTVVLIHVCITALSDFPDSGSEGWRIMYQAVRNVLHFAVPCFFMISGALLLSPEKKLPLEKLLKKYILKYSAVIVLFGWAFAFMEEVFKTHSISVSVIASSFLNMLQGETWNHMWYMYSLLGVTLILPVLKATTEKLNENEMRYLLIVCFVFLSVIPYLCILTGKESGVRFAIDNVYVAYMLVGYWIDTHQKQQTALYISAIVIGIVLLVAEALCSAYYQVELAFSGYSSPVVFLMSAAGFALARSMENPDPKVRPAVQKCKAFLSSNSFGVYIIHMLWINMIYKFIKWNPFDFMPLINMLLIWAVVTILSLFTTFVMRKIPVLKTIV